MVFDRKTSCLIAFTGFFSMCMSVVTFIQFDKYGLLDAFPLVIPVQFWAGLVLTLFGLMNFFSNEKVSK